MRPPNGIRPASPCRQRICSQRWVLYQGRAHGRDSVNGVSGVSFAVRRPGLLWLFGIRRQSGSFCDMRHLANCADMEARQAISLGRVPFFVLGAGFMVASYLDATRGLGQKVS